MAEAEILKGEVLGLVLEAAPLAGPAVQVCAKRHSSEDSLSGVHYDYTVYSIKTQIYSLF